jgi:hypothetical protein
MQKILQNVLNNYLQAKTEAIKGHDLAKFIRQDAIQTIYDKAYIDPNRYYIKGSVGQGQWATGPWIAIMDPEITRTPQEGYYIVYLFTEDMKGVFLSLNQGWTYFHNKYEGDDALKNIAAVSRYWKKELYSALDDFDNIEIALRIKGSNHRLLQGYENGHILGLYYSANNIPPSSTLADDLRNILGVYRELKGKISNRSVTAVNDSILHDTQGL